MKRKHVKIACALLLLLLVICEIMVNRGLLTEKVLNKYRDVHGLYINNESLSSDSPMPTNQTNHHGYNNRTLISNLTSDLTARGKKYGYFVRRQPATWMLSRIEYNASYKNPCWWDKNKLHCLPYFFVGGFPKCGSHELYSKLAIHPGIVKPVGKEINWWTRRQNVQDPNLDDYINRFQNASTIIRYNPGFITYDASAQTVWDNRLIYPFFNDTVSPDPKELMVRKIHRLLPDAKCILIVRNPVERLYSDYLYFRWLSLHKNRSKSLQDFHIRVVSAIDQFNACRKDPKRSHSRCMYGFVDFWDLVRRLRIGMYVEHVRNWLTVFPANQLLVIRLEDYSRRPATTLQDIFSFLELKAVPVERIKIYIERSVVQNTNKKAYERRGPMWNETMDLLTKFYRPYNEQLAELLHDRCFLFEDN